MFLFTSAPSASRLALALSLSALLLTTACSKQPAPEPAPSSSPTVTASVPNASNNPTDSSNANTTNATANVTASNSPTNAANAANARNNQANASNATANAAAPQATSPQAASPDGQIPEFTANDLFVLAQEDAATFNATLSSQRVRLHGNFVKYRPDLKAVYVSSEHTERDRGFIVAQAADDLAGLDQLTTLAPGSALTLDVILQTPKSEAGLLVLNAQLLAAPAQDDSQYESVTAKDLLTSLTRDVVGASDKYQGRVLIVEGTITSEEKHGKFARPFKLMRPEGVPSYAKVSGLSAEAMATLSTIKPFVGLNIFDETRPDKHAIDPRFSALKKGDKVRARVKIMLVDPVGMYCDVLSVDKLPQK